MKSETESTRKTADREKERERETFLPGTERNSLPFTATVTLCPADSSSSGVAEVFGNMPQRAATRRRRSSDRANSTQNTGQSRHEQEYKVICQRAA